MYRELTTPAPVILRQNPNFNPTPPTPCVPCEWVVSGFYVVFGIFGGGGGQLGGVSWFRKKGIRGSDEGFRGEKEKGLMMMTDEDLREQRRARKQGQRSEVQGRLRGRVRRLCKGVESVQVWVCGWLREEA